MAMTPRPILRLKFAQAATPPQTVGKREQRILGQQPSVGIVRIDDDGDARVGELAQFGRRDKIVPRELGGVAMLGIGRREYRRPAARQHERRARAGEMAREGLNFEPCLISGEVAHELIKAAKQHDMIIAGARGEEILLDFGLGRTSIHYDEIDHAACPLGSCVTSA